jgi:hypothetical protein
LAAGPVPNKDSKNPCAFAGGHRKLPARKLIATRHHSVFIVCKMMSTD